MAAVWLVPAAVLTVTSTWQMSASGLSGWPGAPLSTGHAVAGSRAEKAGGLTLSSYGETTLKPATGTPPKSTVFTVDVRVEEEQEDALAGQASKPEPSNITEGGDVLASTPP